MPGDGPWRLTLARTGVVVAARMKLARSWRSRLVGLLGSDALPEGQALFFPRCASIHTIGMRFLIDAIFINRAWRVVALRPNLRPGRLLLPVWKAWGVVEAAQGVVARTGLRVGDQLQLVAIQPEQDT